jgi:hypothetical protein
MYILSNQNYYKHSCSYILSSSHYFKFYSFSSLASLDKYIYTILQTINGYSNDQKISCGYRTEEIVPNVIFISKLLRAFDKLTSFFRKSWNSPCTVPVKTMSPLLFSHNTRQIYTSVYSNRMELDSRHMNHHLVLST